SSPIAGSATAGVALARRRGDIEAESEPLVRRRYGLFSDPVRARPPIGGPVGKSFPFQRHHAAHRCSIRARTSRMHAVSALLIGQHPATVAAVRSCLRPRSHALIEESSAGDGLRRLFAVRPDLVLLDLDLADGAAWETIDRIREITDVPVLALAEDAPEL